MNRTSRRALVVLSVIALLVVLSGLTSPPGKPLPADEGAAAHIFQLSVGFFILVALLFFATADWKQPSRIVRPLALPTSLLIGAFAALYYLEHYWFRPL
jgi:hypothetical protein